MVRWILQFYDQTRHLSSLTALCSDPSHQVLQPILKQHFVFIFEGGALVGKFEQAIATVECNFEHNRFLSAG